MALAHCKTGYMILGVLSWITLATPQSFSADADDEGLPLKPERQVRFQTDEGTWISLDITPNGDRLIFELLGDLYSVALKGGEAVAVTTGMAFDSQPRISPDGQWMTFISDRSGADNLWIARLDGSEPRQLSDETHAALVSPEWTPDGDYVVVTRVSEKTQLRMYHIKGGKGVALATMTEDGKPSEDGVKGLGVSISQDGRYFYYAGDYEADNPEISFPTAQIYRFDRETGFVDRITQGHGGGVRPQVSPDGTQLVYATRHETKTGLRIRDLQSGADRWLKWPIQRDAQEIGRIPSRDYLPGYTFTPDGQHLVISYGGKVQSINIADGQVSPIPFLAQVDLSIGPSLQAPYRVPEGQVRVTIAHSPSFSPDGERVVLSALTKIYIVDLRRNEPPTRLTTSDAWEFKPVWSPDGRWIAYVTWSADKGGHIWRMRSNGSGRPQRLTDHAAFYTDLTFSPDGEHLLAMQGNDFARSQTFSEFGGLDVSLDLVWIPATGGEATLIRPARGMRSPHFAQSADRIYLYDGKALVSIQFDGTDLRSHLKVQGPKGNRRSKDPLPAEQVVAAPDGKWAIALVNKQVWLIALPVLGSDAATVKVRQPALPAVRLTDVGADFLSWSRDGEYIQWALGSTVYRRPLDSIEFKKKDEKEDDGDDPKPDKKQAEDPRDSHAAVSRFDLAIYGTRERPSGSVLLKGGTVIAMTGAVTEEMIRPQVSDVLVTDNRIIAVGDTNAMELPADTMTLDMTGKYLLPGFIDTHAHWEFRVDDVLEPQNWSLVANLAYGVTAGLDVQTNHKDYFSYRDLVETGQSVGQRAFMTGPGVFGNTDFQSYEETLAYLKRYTQHYRTNNLKSYVVGNRKQRQWVVQASKALGLLTTTEGAGDFRLNLTHAIDGMWGNEHALPHAPLYKDVVELFAQTNIAYTPTLIVQYNGERAREYFFTRTEVHDDEKLRRFYPHNRLDVLTRRRPEWLRDDEFSFPLFAAQAAKILRAGGRIGVGGHAELQGLGYHWEMWAMAMGGMTPAEILRAATIDGAKIIGIEQDLGSVTSGKLADLAILDDNPLDDIKNTNTVSFVVKNGVVYDADTMKQLWPQERDPQSWWWLQDDQRYQPTQ